MSCPPREPSFIGRNPTVISVLGGPCSLESKTAFKKQPRSACSGVIQWPDLQGVHGKARRHKLS